MRSFRVTTSRLGADTVAGTRCTRRRQAAGRSPVCLAVAGIALLLVQASAYGQCPTTPGSGAIRQLDDYGSGPRYIADLEHGGLTELDDDQIIDVVILGDGFLNNETEEFFDEACDWYDTLFDPNNGIHPYNDLRAAFRVRAVFEASDERASSDRDSYYRVKIVDANCGVASADGWWNDSGVDDWVFRQRLYEAIDGLDPPVNYALLYDGLDEPPEPDPNSCYQEEENMEFFYPRDHLYSNLVVAMLVRADCSTNLVSGCAPCVCRETNCQPDGESERVRVAFAQRRQHEFTHAFAYALDEYIRDLGDSALYWNPSGPSVFTLWNVSFSYDRCDLLWPHLAPGGRYNPDLYSPIGRLFMGGRCEEDVWHSEYLCLMNGESNNYVCDFDSGPGHQLKTCHQLCFWCEEVVAVKILEKTGQFIRAGDPSDVNELGCTWYELWDSELRDAYYAYFDVPARIAERNAHYAECDGEASCSHFINCGGSEILVPECLVRCDIAEYGNAIYVDSADGSSWNEGSRLYPVDTIENGIALANWACSDLPLVAIKPGSYPPQTLSEPAVLVAEACESVVIGE